MFVLLQDLSPGSVEEAEEAEPDDEFKDAIEVKHILFSDVYFFMSQFFHKCDPVL